MRILIVDDDYTSRTKIKCLLGEYGDCDAVRNGEIALNMFKMAYEEQVPYDLVTMDINMPNMSGKDVVREILAFEQAHDPKKSPSVKIVMMTVQNKAQDVMESFNEGCDGYIIKPVTPEKISKVLKDIGLR